MINKCILVGRITKDPEIKYTTSNIAVVTFVVAVPRQYADNSGEKQTDFIQCVVWRKQAENMAKYVKKGALLGVEGRIQTRTYDSEGGTRYITEVVCDSVQFLDSRNSDDRYQAPVNEPQMSQADDPFMQASKKINVSDDDLPF